MKRWIVTGMVLVLALTLWAQAPEMFRYQGRLADGTNLVNATLPMSFKLYDAQSGGNRLYEDSNPVLVVDGLYSTYIGDNTTFGSLTNALTNAMVYLELTVNEETLSPRERLVSVPYALSAGDITQADADLRYAPIEAVATLSGNVSMLQTQIVAKLDATGANITNQYGIYTNYVVVSGFDNGITNTINGVYVWTNNARTPSPGWIKTWTNDSAEEKVSSIIDSSGDCQWNIYDEGAAECTATNRTAHPWNAQFAEGVVISAFYTNGASVASTFRENLDVYSRGKMDAFINNTYTKSQVNTKAEEGVYTTVVLFGDSLTSWNGMGVSGASASSVPILGYFNWAQAFCQTPLVLVTNLGVSGNTTADMRARVSTVVSCPASIVIVCGGVNDYSQNVPAGTTITNLTDIINTLQSAGKCVLLLTVPPAEYGSRTPYLDIQRTVNSWILSAPTIFKNLYVADIADAITDYTTGCATTNMTVDGVHWSGLGACRVGSVVASALDKMVPYGSRVWVAKGSSKNIFSDNTFTSTWAKTISEDTVTYSASSQYNGNVATIVCSANTSAHLIYRTENMSSGLYTNGDIIKFRADISWSSALCPTNKSSFSPYMKLIAQNIDDSVDTYQYVNQSSGSEETY